MSRPRFIILALVLGTLAVYLPATHHGFTLFDDNDYVTENPIVENGLTWAGVKWAFTTWHASNWHPLTWLSHMLDCQLFGLNSGVHHTVNVLFHTANAVLLFLLLRRLIGGLWPAAFVAALFAWHPMHVESVAWVAERKDVLSTCFGLLSLLNYARYVQRWPRGESRESRAGKDASTLDYALALVCFAFGLMAKPMLVTLPLVMLLLDYWPLQRLSRVEGRGTKAAIHGALSHRSRRMNNRTALAVWKRTLMMWCIPALRPKSWQSSMCESQVSGCQLLACQAVNAHWTPAHVRPFRTGGLSVT